MKLCVALDMASKDENLSLVKALNGLDIWLKIGLRSYLRDGAKFINEIRNIGNFKLFLDLKIYDIPNTMADACEVCANLGVDMINLHASSGKTAMKAVMDRLSKLKTRPLVLGVSALTSFDADEFNGIYHQNIADAVRQMSKNAYECGLDGMVCSAFESVLIKEATNRDFITLAPGIRPFGESSGDQKRVADLEFTREQNCDFIVVGRPIYKASNPRLATEKILKNI
ncbi:MAG: orotidine-5'-phosphate decarboxylase [Campylobacter sp.]|nr:orotidine-5'-phosphate decarboxylase [Campylobacter sp.]